MSFNFQVKGEGRVITVIKTSKLYSLPCLIQIQVDNVIVWVRFVWVDIRKRHDVVSRLKSNNPLFLSTNFMRNNNNNHFNKSLQINSVYIIMLSFTIALHKSFQQAYFTLLQAQFISPLINKSSKLPFQWCGLTLYASTNRQWMEIAHSSASTIRCEHFALCVNFSLILLW